MSRLRQIKFLFVDHWPTILTVAAAVAVGIAAGLYLSSVFVSVILLGE